MIGAALGGMGGPIFFGATVGMGLASIISIAEDLDVVKTITHNIVNKENLPASYYRNLETSPRIISEGLKDVVRESKISEPIGVYFDPDWKAGQIPTPGQVSGAAVLPTDPTREPYHYSVVLNTFLKVYSAEKSTLLASLSEEKLASLLLTNQKPSVRQEAFKFIQRFIKNTGAKPTFAQMTQRFPNVRSSSSIRNYIASYNEAKIINTDTITWKDLYSIMDIRKANDKKDYLYRIDASRFQTYYKTAKSASFFRARANSIKSKFNFLEANMALTEFLSDIRYDLSYKYKIYELFNELSTNNDLLAWKDISMTIKGQEAFDKGPARPSQKYIYFDRLVNVFLLNPHDVDSLGIPASNLDLLKESMYYYTVDALSKREGGLNIEKFNVIFSVLLAKNYIKGNSKPIYPMKGLISLNDLSESISTSQVKTHARHYLSDSLSNDKIFHPAIIKNLKEIVRIDNLNRFGIKSFFNRIERIGLSHVGLLSPKESVQNYVVKYRPNIYAEYHEYFKELMVPQQKEMVDITLGFDVLLQQFYSKSSNKLGIQRHHPDRDKNFYTVFEFDEDGNWKVKLLLLTNWRHFSLHATYKQFGAWNQFHRQNDLARARVKHLSELVLTRRYQSGIDYQLEFDGREALVAGNIEKIWADLDPDILDQWIEKWKDKQSMTEGDWYDTHFPAFYRNTYLPYMDNFALYLQGDSKAKNPEFWKWYLTAYLHENIYPN